ncbi:MAG TPA: type II toxin-antitoxin system YafQ family toxin [Acidobacteriaceae bacterium]|nr:type II toxin-antitoxin system YafQ family toxin [Acidobacteriaceae bacterium]
MRTIKFTSRFKRDYKRESRGQHRLTLEADMFIVVERLAADEPLPHSQYDHPLVGEWADHRDCHIQPDLVLIYRKPDVTTLELVRIGSHSELGI